MIEASLPNDIISNSNTKTKKTKKGLTTVLAGLTLTVPDGVSYMKSLAYPPIKPRRSGKADFDEDTQMLYWWNVPISTKKKHNILLGSR